MMRHSAARSLILATAAIMGGMSFPMTRHSSGTYSVTLGQTDADREALAAAEAKRQRKNAKRAAQRQSADKGDG